MLELPEIITLYKDLSNTIIGKEISYAIANESEHKFAFYNGDPSNYTKMLEDKKVIDIKHYGFYVCIEFDDVDLFFRDGTNIRFHKDGLSLPKKHQLFIEFKDATFLTVSIAMYGIIWCCGKGEFDDNQYFKIAKNSILPISNEFNYDHFNNLFLNCKNTISAKAFLATEQRMNGIGNGVVQDILFNAGIHPKRKLNTFKEEEKLELFHSVKNILDLMIKQGGRDTEKNLFDQYGGYKTMLSKNTLKNGCPNCGDDIIKENYLGGSIYYCSHCQKIS